MKVIRTTEIDGYKIVAFVNNANLFIDAEATYKSLAKKGIDLKKLPTAQRQEIIYDNAIYFNIQSHSKFVTDEDGEHIKQLILNNRDNAIIDINANVIIDNRKKVIYQKINNIWEKIKIEKIGEDIPVNAIEEKNLTEQQKIEIAEQSIPKEEPKEELKMIEEK